MARSPVFLEVKDAAGNYVSGASVTVKDRRTGANATLYSAESAGTTVTNPLTSNAAGQVSSWADRGQYLAVVSGGGITTYTVPLEPATAEDATGVVPWIPARYAGSGTTFVGKTIINTAETTAATTHPFPPSSNLATPDRVTGVTVTGGVIMVMYRALYQQSVASNSSWIIYLNTTQVKGNAASAPAALSFAGAASTADDEIIFTSSGTLNAVSAAGAGNATDITTGQTLANAQYPGWLPIHVAPGTYDVSISVRVTSGNVTVKNRKLWVWSWA